MTTHTDLARPSLEADLAAAQIATVATSRAKLDRARAYAGRLGSHAAEVRAKLAAASERGVAAAIGTSEASSADAGPLRGELIAVDRQHRQAVAALADIQAEHARHEADLAALTGSDGAARASLAEAHAARALAQTTADAAKGILDRATAHAGTVRGKLAAARAEEARHDADATARLRAALADGDAPPAAAEPLSRVSGALEDDLRAATAAEPRIVEEHRAKLSTLAVAERQVRAAADAVLMSDADAMAREVEHLDARSKLLRDRIAAYAGRTAGDYVPEPWTPPKNILHPGGWFYPEPGKLAVPPQPRTVARTPTIMAVLPSRNDGAFVPVEVAAWSAYASDLARDPKAEPDFPVLSALDRTPALPDPSVTPASLSLLSSRTAA